MAANRRRMVAGAPGQAVNAVTVASSAANATEAVAAHQSVNSDPPAAYQFGSGRTQV
jgi:hypothetical protein